MDVNLLGRAVIKLLEKFYTQFNVHPLDVNKTTIASYVGYLLQNHLMVNKRIGQWSPNILPMYSALKDAATGGLTMVTRHSADGNNKFECKINSHLFPTNDIQGQGVAVFDIASLYPSSCLFNLPFGPGYFSLRLKISNETQPLIYNNKYDNYTHNLFNSKECEVVQYLSLVEYANSLRVFSAFHSGPGQIVFGKTLKRYKDLCVLNNSGEITFIQFHERSHLVSNTSHSLKCKYYTKAKNKQLEYNYETTLADDENMRYAEYLTKHIPELNIKYKVYNECDFFHGNFYAFKNKTVQYASPKEYLLAQGYEKECVFKPDWLNTPCMTENFLLDKIFNTTECDNGYVVIEKGATEEANDLISKQFAFCLQRHSPSIDDLGPQAYELAKEIVEENVVCRENESEDQYKNRLNVAVIKFLNNRIKSKFTLTRQSYKSDSALPVIFFKWLEKNRGILKTTKIIHYIHYEARNYLKGFVYQLLQDRHTINLEKGPNDLGASNLKVASNAGYGQYMMEKSRYHKFTYAYDESLKRCPPTNANSINLLSAVKREDSKVSFLYHLKYSLSNSLIRNLLQVGAMILGYSRVIFYTKILTLLKLLDPKKAELCYLDTDSVMFFLASSNLKLCVKKGQEAEFENLSKSQLFVDPTSKFTQAGLMKMEGYYQAGFFKCIKNYILLPFSNTNEKKVTKCKAMARVIKNQIPNESFLVSNRKRKMETAKSNCTYNEPPIKKQKMLSREKLFFQHYSLHPTMGEQMVISKKRRKMPNSINCKRRMTKVIVYIKNLFCFICIFCFIFQDQCHTYPLD